MSLTCLSLQTAGSTVRSPAASIDVADRSSTLPLGQRAVRHRREPDIGIETDLMAGMARQHGPPRGCEMSPTSRPGHSLFFLTSPANLSSKAMRSGWPQLRLRDKRITRQAGPSIGSALAPARQPLAYHPMARACERRRGLYGTEQLLGWYRRSASSFASLALGVLALGFGIGALGRLRRFSRFSRHGRRSGGRGFVSTESPSPGAASSEAAWRVCGGHFCSADLFSDGAGLAAAAGSRCNRRYDGLRRAFWPPAASAAAAAGPCHDLSAV